MKFNKLLILTGLLFLFAIHESLAANYYVRVGATGNGSGSDWTNAWNGFPSINQSALNPGDIIFIAGGTYGPLSIGRSGTLGNPITYKRAVVADHGTNTGWNNAYDARVIIDGQDSWAGVGFEGSSEPVVFREHITIDGVTRYGIWIINAFYGVRAPYGSSHITLRNLETGDAGAGRLDEDGIQGRGDDLIVENCYIHDNDSDITHGDGIQWFGGNRITIRYNIWKNNGQQIYLGEGSWNEVVNDVNICYNLIYNRGGGHYNGLVFFGNNTQAGRFYNFFNNTIDLESPDNSGFNSVFYPITGNASYNFKNNAVIYSNAFNVQNTTTHTNNAYDNSGPYANYYIPSTETGVVLAADLGFVNVEAADYHLLSTSPLIDAGTNVGLTKDFDGKTVPANPSIGAFEYGSGTIAAPSNPSYPEAFSDRPAPCSFYNISGRKVASHLLSTSGKRRPFGLYLTRVNAGDRTTVQKVLTRG